MRRRSQDSRQMKLGLPESNDIHIQRLREENRRLNAEADRWRHPRPLTGWESSRDRRSVSTFARRNLLVFGDWLWQSELARKHCCFFGNLLSINVPAALERSRSENGGHVWIFFHEPILARTARALGSFLLTRTLEKRHQIGLTSYDRMFPNQDTLPRDKKLGNLIALPLQRLSGKQGNSLFIDANYNPYPDQWVYLSSLRKMKHWPAKMENTQSCWCNVAQFVSRLMQKLRRWGVPLLMWSSLVIRISPFLHQNPIQPYSKCTNVCCWTNHVMTWFLMTC